jgi:hypothetical protein
MTAADRVAALLEVVICSGFPTQVVVAFALGAAGLRPIDAAGHLSGAWVVALSLADAALVMGLIVWFTRLHGERPREAFLGRRPVIAEALLGLPAIVVVFALVVVLMAALQGLAPWMHNVPRNPLQDLIRTPRDRGSSAWSSSSAAGARGNAAGLRPAALEHLGGAWIGLVLFSAAFGAGHVIQGWDVA